MPGDKVMPTIENAHKALEDATGVLDTLHVPYCLDGGTLLGFYRDKDFAEEDHDDIDLTVLAHNWKHARAITQAMLEIGFEVYREWPRNVTNHLSGQLAFKRDDVKVDLMFKETKPESDKVWWTIYGGPNRVTYKAVPLNFLDIFTRDGEGKYRYPYKVEDYLEYRYGDWKTPVHRRDYSCYTTDKSIVKENTYEAI